MGDTELGRRIRIGLRDARQCAWTKKCAMAETHVAFLDDVAVLLDRHDRLHDAAVAVLEAVRHPVGADSGTACTSVGFTETHLLDALAAALPSPPEPLKVGDTVTREDADRVPVGAILKESDGCPVWRTPLGWLESGDSASSETPPNCDWPWTILWLPEPSDA